MRRTRQSNRAEICPVENCGKLLLNRAAAVSHYRAHARRGELEQRGGIGEGCAEWRLLDQTHIAYAWWSHGPAYHYGCTDLATIIAKFRAQIAARAAERSRQEWVRCDSAGPHLCPNPATRQMKVPADYDGSPAKVLYYCETCYSEMYGPYGEG